MEVMVERIDIVEVASLVDRNTLCQFTIIYPCLPAPARFNTQIKFRLADASQATLTNSPSLIKLSTWADLLA